MSAQHTSLPAFTHQYFWDSAITTIDVQQNAPYIIDRILALGNQSSVTWLLRTYSREQVYERVTKSRNLSAKDKHFYSLILQ